MTSTPEFRSPIHLTGYNHLALVCSDMERTVDFYCNVLGMTLIKAFDLPNGRGQHFFFDIGAGTLLAFFWLPDAPAPAPGIAQADPRMVTTTNISMATAVGSMNHVAFDCPEEKVDGYRQTLRSMGVAVTPVINHDDTPGQRSREINDTTYVRSFYFLDPDGILLEIGALTRAVDPTTEVRATPATPADRQRYLTKLEEALIPGAAGMLS